MDVLVTGSHGLVATALLPALHRAGHRVVRLVRSATGGDGDVRWDPAAGTIDAAAVEGIDAVVHLAGEGIGDRRWSDDVKQRIVDSRVQGTTLLAETLAGLERRPSVLVSASAVGYYGDRGEEVLSEDSPAGGDFLAQVCRRWEECTAPAAAAGIRTVCLRTGVILTARGGALTRMLLPFKLGLGGRIGSGRQWMSWVSLADEVGVIMQALADDRFTGPVNTTAPEPVRNRDFVRTLGEVLHRPTVLPTPLLPLRARYGAELVQHLLLDSQRVMPARLTGLGYEWAHPTLRGALEATLRRDHAGNEGD